MAYSSSGKLPEEHASKLGHLSVIRSPWVQSLIEDFEAAQNQNSGLDFSLWHDFDLKDFIYESNQGHDVFFVATREEAISMLAR